MRKIGNIKGSSVNLTKQFLTENFGPEAVKKIVAEMKTPNKEIFLRTIFPMEWLPEIEMIHFLIQANKIFSKKDYDLSRQIGYYIAKKGIPIFYTVFIRNKDLNDVLKSAPRFWRQIHDNGHLEVVNAGPKSATVRIINKVFPHKAFCETMIGYFQAISEMIGLRGVSIKEIQCAAEGGRFCEYAINWK